MPTTAFLGLGRYDLAKIRPNNTAAMINFVAATMAGAEAAAAQLNPPVAAAVTAAHVVVTAL
eukprot:gene432-691_t